MLTRKQHELICFIEDRLNDSGVSPSFEEMKEALDLKSKSGVHRLISALEERGYLRRLPNRARALEVLKTPERPEPKKAAPPSTRRDSAARPDRRRCADRGVRRVDDAAGAGGAAWQRGAFRA